MAFGKEEKQAIINEFARAEQDTGSTQVQVALLTHAINSLTEHCKKNKKDYSTRRGLLQKVTDRKRLLLYLQKKNHSEYKELIAKLGLRK
jgi:small subunit ribosomal protein S15